MSRAVARGCLLSLVLSGCATVSQDRMSQTDRDIANSERALANAQLAHDRVGEGIALQNLGDAYRARGQSATAITYLTQALAIWRIEHDRTREGRTLNALGRVYQALGQYDKALTLYEQKGDIVTPPRIKAMLDGIRPTPRSVVLPS